MKITKLSLQQITKIKILELTSIITLLSIGISNIGYIFGLLGEGEFTFVIILSIFTLILSKINNFKIKISYIYLILFFSFMSIPIIHNDKINLIPLAIFIVKLFITFSIVSSIQEYNNIVHKGIYVFTLIIIIEFFIFILVSLDFLHLSNRRIVYYDISGVRFGGFAFELVDQVTFLCISYLFIREAISRTYVIILSTIVLILIISTGSNFVIVIAFNFAAAYLTMAVFNSSILRFLLFFLLFFEMIIIAYVLNYVQQFLNIQFVDFNNLTTATRDGARILPTKSLLDCFMAQPWYAQIFGLGFIDFTKLCTENFLLSNSSGSSKFVATFGIPISIFVVGSCSYTLSKLQGPNAIAGVIVATYVGCQASFTNLSILFLMTLLITSRLNFQRDFDSFLKKRM